MTRRKLNLRVALSSNETTPAPFTLVLIERRSQAEIQMEFLPRSAFSPHRSARPGRSQLAHKSSLPATDVRGNFWICYHQRRQTVTSPLVNRFYLFNIIC